MITSSVVDWNMVFCVYAVMLVMLSIWWCLVASTADSVRAAVHGAWPKVPHCWLMSVAPQIHAPMGAQRAIPAPVSIASQPKIMGKALGIVDRTIATHLTHKAGYTYATAHTGAVTLIQRFGGALKRN